MLCEITRVVSMRVKYLKSHNIADNHSVWLEAITGSH